MRELEHIIKIEAGHDCIKFECLHNSKKCIPGSVGSHGRSGLSIRFVSKGEKGAVQFLLHTDWIPQFTTRSKIGHLDIREWASGLTLCYPLPADLGYHSKTPRYEDQKPISEECEFCDEQPCYYDGSSLNASDAMYTLINGGGEALWKFLDGYYDSVYNNGEYPNVKEYKMPLRKESP